MYPVVLSQEEPPRTIKFGDSCAKPCLSTTEVAGSSLLLAVRACTTLQVDRVISDPRFDVADR